MSQKNSYWT